MNKVVHFEIPFDENERATKFYKEVFGWEISQAPDMPYWIVTTVATDEQRMPKESGAINGGMYKRDKNSSKNPVLVIDVPSVKEHVKKIEESGGKVVMEERKVGDMGIYAQVEDTEGNILGLWQALSH